MADASYIPRLWSMIDAAQQRLQPSRDQVTAWENTSGMLSGHASRLQQCRDQLATLWPPEQNAASAAYMAELDRLIDAARQTSTAAQNNAIHIDHVAGAIDQARNKLEPIYQEYVKNQALLADYQRQVEQAGNIGGVLGTGAGAPLGLGVVGRLAGDFVGEKAMRVATDPPVSDAQQAALIERAHAVQKEVDGAARDGSSRIQPPPEYIPPPVQRRTPPPGKSDPNDPIRPPVVNPPPRSQGGPDDRPGYIDGTPPPDVHTEITPTPTGTTGDGPSLTGITPPGSTLPVPTPPPGPPVGPPPPPTVGPLPPPLPPGIIVPPGTGGGTGGVSPGGIPRGTSAGPGKIGGIGAGPTGLGAGVPPGGVIGGRPGAAGGGVPGGMGGAGGGAPRANPVGGVIGGQGAGRPGATPGMMGGQRGRQTGDEKDQRHWDPDNPWAVEEGVAPEIEPNRHVGRHDPGSGVIGKDR